MEHVLGAAGAVGLAVQLVRLVDVILGRVTNLLDKKGIVKYDVWRHLFCMQNDLAILADAVEAVLERQRQNAPISRGVQLWLENSKVVIVSAEDLVERLTYKYDRYMEKRARSRMYRMFSVLHKPFSRKKVRKLMVMEERVYEVTKHACAVLQLTTCAYPQRDEYERRSVHYPSCFGI